MALGHREVNFIWVENLEHLAEVVGPRGKVITYLQERYRPQIVATSEEAILHDARGRQYNSLKCGAVCKSCCGGPTLLPFFKSLKDNRSQR